MESIIKTNEFFYNFFLSLLLFLMLSCKNEHKTKQIAESGKEESDTSFISTQKEYNKPDGVLLNLTFNTKELYAKNK